jgi:hypothetical protein
MRDRASHQETTLSSPACAHSSPLHTAPSASWNSPRTASRLTGLPNQPYEQSLTHEKETSNEQN